MPVYAETQRSVEDLRHAMQFDPCFAWAWHCNLASVIEDNTGCGNAKANDAAAAFMRLAFDVDTTRMPTLTGEQSTEGR